MGSIGHTRHKTKTNKAQKHKRKLKRSVTRKHHKTGVNSGGREGQVVAASQKTPTVILTYLAKSDKSSVGDRGKKNIYAKKKRSTLI